MDRPSVVPTSPIAPGAEALAAPRPGTFAAFSVPHYPRLWLAGFIWNLTRWMSIFLCSYLINQLTHSPFLVELVGVMFFAPMFIGGAVAGVVSDRFDRRRTMLLQMAFLMPCAAAVAVLNLTDMLRAWMIYPFMLAVGIGMVLDMTSRRALVYDLVGEERVTNALALEALAQTSGSMLGSFSAGAVISLLGTGHTFTLIAGLYCLSFALLLGVRARPAAARPKGSPTVLQDLRAAFSYARRQPQLISILGVTIVMNLFCYSFTPLVPVFADDLGVGALLAGALASANAFGSMLGTFMIARGLPVRRGVLYVAGSAIALSFLVIFAAASWYWVALAALICTGIGTSGFSTMQSVLVMSSAEPEMRGRALGLMSMGIGTLPFSMLVLGGIAQVAGPGPAVMGSVILGLSVLLVWSVRRPEAWRME